MKRRANDRKARTTYESPSETLACDQVITEFIRATHGAGGKSVIYLGGGIDPVDLELEDRKSAGYGRWCRKQKTINIRKQWLSRTRSFRGGSLARGWKNMRESTKSEAVAKGIGGLWSGRMCGGVLGKERQAGVWGKTGRPKEKFSDELGNRHAESGIGLFGGKGQKEVRAGERKQTGNSI